jgi:phage tail-like protein
MEQSYISTTAPAEWRRWAGQNVEVKNGALGLASEPTIEYTNLRITAVDISVDRDGNLLVLDEDGNIQWQGDEQGLGETVWTNGDGRTIEQPRGLCVAGDRLYVIDGATGSVVLVSRRSETVIGEIDARLDEPIELLRTDDRLYILDAGTDDRQGRVLTLRRNGMVETVVRGLDSPTDVTADSANLYVIEQPDGEPAIRIHDLGHLDSPGLIPTSRALEDLRVDGDENPVVPLRIEMLTDQELVVLGETAEGDETNLYHYTFEGEEGTLTLRDNFALSCSKLLTGPRNQNRRFPKYYAIAGEQNHVYIIDERQTNCHNAVDQYRATAYKRHDSGAVDTNWGRLTLDFDSFPANTQVVASYSATNHRTQTGTIDDLEIPEDACERLRTNDIETPWDLVERGARTIANIVGDGTTDRADTWRDAALEVIDTETEWVTPDSANQQDMLLEHISGRYLDVKLELVGGITASPAVGSFTAYCPKQSYLRYLPQTFTQDKTSEQFLERYLSIFESEFVDIEREIERITEYLDPEGVPNEYLSWLSDWLAIEYDEEWPTAAKREFLSAAPTLFTLRGTKEGMRRTIRLYLRHVERPNTTWMAEWRKRRIEARRSDGEISDAEVGARLRQIDDRNSGYPEGHLLFFFEYLDLDRTDSASAREPYTMHMDGPRSFTTFIGPFIDESHRNAVQRIVASQRPAHTHGEVVELRQELKLDGGTFLGINSTLTTREFVLGKSTLGGDTVLAERELLR